jgi:tetratricopeptide (TPR) repeat protein
MSNGPGPHAIAARHAPREDTAVERTRRLRRAALLHLDGDLAGAEAEYAALLDQDPGNAAVLNNLGLVRAQRGDPAAALAAYEAIGADEQLSPTALLNKANAHLALAAPDRAVPLLQRAVTLDPDSSAWVALGQAHLVGGDLAAAEAAFRQAYERLPARADVLRSYGSCLAARGQLTDAAALLAGAARMDDHDASTWRQLATVLLSLRDLGSAARAARAAVELEPDAVPSLRQLAVVLVALGQPTEAAAHLDHALALDHSADLLVDRAVLHLAARETEAAVLMLEEAASSDPTGRARLHLAYALLASDRVHEGRDQLKTVSSLAGACAIEACAALDRLKDP